MSTRLLKKSGIIFAGGLAAALALFSNQTAARAAQAEDVAVVLSSDLDPYRRTVAGFEKELGGPFSKTILSKQGGNAGKNARAVVILGAPAALRHYPADAALVYTLCPGFKPAASSLGRQTTVSMVPAAGAAVKAIKNIQPGLKRIAIFWSSEPYGVYLKALAEAGREAGLEVLSKRLSGIKDLPDGLRQVHASAGAVWLLPDPPLVNAEIFSVIKEFTLTNKMAFYAPAEGLVEKGAPVALSCEYAEIGALAAEQVKKALAGQALPEVVYPSKVRIAFNLEAAAACDLLVTPELRQQADKVAP
jgi:hypothetical protein